MFIFLCLNLSYFCFSSLVVKRITYTNECEEKMERLPYSQFEIERCIFVENSYRLFSLSDNLNYINESFFKDSECSEPIAYLQHKTTRFECFEYLTENYLGIILARYVIEEEQDFSDETVMVMNYFRGKQCEGDIQYTSYVQTPSILNLNFPSISEYKIYSGDYPTFLCEKGVPIQKLFQFLDSNGEATDYKYNFTLSGCRYDKNIEYLENSVGMSNTFSCGSEQFVAKNDRKVDAQKFLAPYCFESENCSINYYSYAWGSYYDQCYFDNSYNQFFKFVECNSNYGLLKRNIFTGPYCEGVVEFSDYEYLFSSYNNVPGKRLECNIDPNYYPTTNLVLLPFYDQECKLPGYMSLHLPVRVGCSKFSILNYGLLAKFGIKQECKGNGEYVLETRFGDCDKSKKLLLEVKFNITNCNQTPDFLRRFENRFPFVIPENSEFCRTCNGIHHYQQEVCNERGECFENEKPCSCKDGYGGSDCQEVESILQIKMFVQNSWWVFLLSFVGLVTVLVITMTLIIFVCIVMKISRSRKLQIEYAPNDDEEEIVIIFTSVQNYMKLCSSSIGKTDECMAMYNELIRKLIKKYYCYEVKTISDVFMIATDDLKDALLLCLEIQEECTKLPYPKEFLYLEDFQTQNNDEGEVMYRGLRISIGIHKGLMEVSYDQKRNCYDYFGNGVNFASRIKSSAPGGSIFLSREVYEESKYWDYEELGGRVEFQDTGMNP